MNVFLVNKVLDIKSKGGTWEDLIYSEKDGLDFFTYELLFSELNLSKYSSECEIEASIVELFHYISSVGVKND